jgi:Phage tail tube protein
MGFTSQQGQVGFAIQAVKGTPLAATRFARLRGGSLGGDRELLIPDPEIGGNRDIPQAYLGPIAFSGGYEFYARSEMLAMLFRGAFGTTTDSNVAGTTEVQTITTTGTPAGGTFTLTYRGSTTAPIAFNAAAAAVDTALELLPTIGAGNVVCAGGPLPTGVTVTFSGGTLATQSIRPITANASGLTGGTNPTVVVTETTPGFGPRGTHVITPSDSASLPWMSVEEAISASYESFRYTDAKVSRLRIEADATGYMMGQVDMIALTQTSGFTKQTNPPIDVSPMFLGQQVLIYWNGIALPAKSFFFECNNNMEDDDFRLGDFKLGDLTEKRREFTMGATVRPADAQLWKEATYGGSALTAPRAGAASLGILTLVCNTFENVQGAASPYSIQITAPTVAMSPFRVEPRGDDVIEHDIEFRLLRDDPIPPPVSVTIINDLATVV